MMSFVCKKTRSVWMFLFSTWELLHTAVFLRELTVDFNSGDKQFLSCAQCHRIDVVSGCGKNAEGAVQTLSLVFHNLSKNINPCSAKVFDFLGELHVLAARYSWYSCVHTSSTVCILPSFRNTHNVSPIFVALSGPLVTWPPCFCAAVLSAIGHENMAVHITGPSNTMTAANWIEGILIRITVRHLSFSLHGHCNHVYSEHKTWLWFSAVIVYRCFGSSPGSVFPLLAQQPEEQLEPGNDVLN